MIEFLTSWGIELVFGIIATAISSFFVWKNKQLKIQLDKAAKYDKDQEIQEVDSLIDKKIKPLKEEHRQMDADLDKKLEPIYEELENLREYERITRGENDAMKKLLIDSWKYRLKVLCQMHLEHGYITFKQYDQLQEFYRCYSEMGGNGQAKELYERAIKLELVPDRDDQE